MPPKVTKAEFAEFKAEVERLLERLRLDEWSVAVTLGGCDDCANITPNLNGMVAEIRMNEHRLEDKDVFSPKDYARHEVAHLVTAKLWIMAGDRSVTAREIDTEFEALANRLGRLFGEI